MTETSAQGNIGQDRARADMREMLDGGGRWGAMVVGGIYAITVSAAILFAAETIPGLVAEHPDLFWTANLCLSLLFLVEYIVRIWAAERRLSYIFSFWGLVDLAATLPILILLGANVAGLRALRLLRLASLFKLLRIGNAGERMGAAIRTVAPEMLAFFCFATVILYFSATGIYFFETAAQPETFSSIPESLWWAVVTLTTVGYGDIYPVTVGGRIFTGFVLLVGLSIVAVPTGLFSSALIEARRSAATSTGQDEM